MMESLCNRRFTSWDYNHVHTHIVCVYISLFRASVLMCVCVSCSLSQALDFSFPFTCFSCASTSCLCHVTAGQPLRNTHTCPGMMNQSETEHICQSVINPALDPNPKLAVDTWLSNDQYCRKTC